MRASHRALFFLDSFASGLMAPFLSLVLLARGATAQSLPLFIGAFSLAVLLCELPSGVFADLFGRKRAFMLAYALLLAKSLLLLAGRGPLTLAAVCLLHGAGRAFSSGSLEALEVESCARRLGQNSLARVNRTLLVLQSAGMAAGALCGGLLGGSGGGYAPLLTAAAALEALVLLMTAAFVAEERPARVPRRERPGWRAQLEQMGALLRASPLIRLTMGAAVLTGLSLTVMEVYWQQELSGLLPAGGMWLLGVVSCTGFAGAMAGGALGEGLLRRRGLLGAYWPVRLAFPAAVLLMGLCRSWPLFAALYVLGYVLLGASELSDRTVMHRESGDGCRAGMLSAYSLVIRCGALLSSAAAGAVVSLGGTGLLWLVVPVISIMGLAALKKLGGGDLLRRHCPHAGDGA